MIIRGTVLSGEEKYILFLFFTYLYEELGYIKEKKISSI